MTSYKPRKGGKPPARGRGVSHASCSKKRTALKERIKALEQRMLHLTMLVGTGRFVVMQEEE